MHTLPATEVRLSDVLINGLAEAAAHCASGRLRAEQVTLPRRTQSCLLLGEEEDRPAALSAAMWLAEQGQRFRQYTSGGTPDFMTTTGPRTFVWIGPQRLPNALRDPQRIRVLLVPTAAFLAGRGILFTPPEVEHHLPQPETVKGGIHAQVAAWLEEARRLDPIAAHCDNGSLYDTAAELLVSAGLESEKRVALGLLDPQFPKLHYPPLPEPEPPAEPKCDCGAPYGHDGHCNNGSNRTE